MRQEEIQNEIDQEQYVGQQQKTISKILRMRMMNHLETLLKDCRSVEEKTTIPALAPLEGGEQLDDYCRW